ARPPADPAPSAGRAALACVAGLPDAARAAGYLRARAGGKRCPVSTRYRSRAGAEFRQVEESDCGAACLGILLAGFGKYLSWPILSQACGGGRDGIGAATLARRGQQ